MHQTGEVPCDDAREAVVWAGPGHGELCAACVRPIAVNETEFEVDLTSGTILRLHRQCHALWLEECGPLIASS